MNYVCLYYIIVDHGIYYGKHCKRKIIGSVYIYKQESTGAKKKEILIHIYI